MKKRIVISAIAVTAMVSSVAQLNNPSTDGYYSRALLMYQDKNYSGCIDQMSQMLELNPTPQQREEADYYIAMSAKSKGDDNAITLLRDFVEKYPSSLHRMVVMMSIGDCYFSQDEYAEALAQYKKVDEATLSEHQAQDYTYRKSYCLLRLADYAEAESGFKRLTGTSKYGNSSRFYCGYIAYIGKNYGEAIKYFDQVEARSELGDMANYYRSQIYFMRKDYAKAYNLAKGLLVKKNVDALYIAEANRIAGESLYNQGDVAGAIPYLKNYVANVEEPLSSTRYILGVSQYKNQDYAQAIETLEGVTKEDNAMGQSAYLMIGNSLLKQGDNHAAMMALDKAVKMPHDGQIQEEAFYNYAVASLQGGTIPFGSSVENFESFLSRYPNSSYAPKVQEYIVTGYMTDNNYERALSSIEKIANPNDAILKAKQRVLYSLGVRELNAGCFDKAISRFSQSKELSAYDPNLAREADLWIGDCYYAKGEYDAAADSYLAFVNASNDEATNLALGYYNLGYARFKSSRYDDAVTNFENFLDDPGEMSNQVVADAYCRIGDCQYFGLDFTAARKSYEQAHATDPSTGDYALFQSAMMKGNEKDIEGKIITLNQVLEQYPASGIVPSALLEKAECYIAQGKYNQAIDTYNQIVSQYPSTAQGRNGCLQLAIAYVNKGEREKAIDTYKKVISNYPTSDEARVASKDLMKLYAEDDNLESYTAFMGTVPGALPVDRTEIEETAYMVAESDYMEGRGVEKLKAYLTQYPGSSYEPSVLSLLSIHEYENDNINKALEYANAVIEKYPDNSAMETALGVRAEIEYNEGKNELALKDYLKLEDCASSVGTRIEARVGIVRVSYELKKYDLLIETADELLNSQIDSDLKNEVLYAKAVALCGTGRGSEAVKIWSSLDDDVDDLYGAMSAVALGQYYYDTNNLTDARKVVEAFVGSSTSQQDWLAYGFILLSDIYRKEGKEFEANEYLRTLRDNYPGQNPDVFKQIDERLK